MSNTQRNVPHPSIPGAVRRKAIITSNTSQESLVKIEQFQESLALLIQPAVDNVDLTAWAINNQKLVEKHLLQYGGILFRNFPLKGVEDFEKFVMGVSGGPLEYRERSSPRSQVSGNIYTSTDYPPEQSIFLHNENSYQQSWPLRILFFCKIAPKQGGETPIADVRKVYERIDPAIRDIFRQKQVMYVRNFGDGFGLPWQTVFQTNDKNVVEEYCRKAGIQWEWKSDNRLRTRRIGQAIALHPYTREMLWFNHATFFHVTTLEATVRETLLAQFAEEDLPNNSYYGDGTPIEDAVLDALRQAYKQETVMFPWQQGDILLLDNMLVAHGRSPFVEPRQILTGMSMPVHSADLSGNR